MTRTLWASIAVAACVLSLLAGCSDEGSKDKADPQPKPQPNGVAGMTPARALAVARKAMTELHDAIYDSTYEIEVEGVTRQVKVHETVTQTGCARETSHPKYGRSWARIIGRNMWVKANDRAGESMGRTPAQIELFRGRWIKFPAPEFLRDCDLAYLLPPRDVTDLVESRGMTKVRGRPGRRFELELGGASITCVIATKGEPLLIKGGTVTAADVLPDLPEGVAYDGTSILTDVDTGAEVEPPPDRLVIDPADFQTVPA
jgi:hypothetical protein